MNRISTILINVALATTLTRKLAFVVLAGALALGVHAASPPKVGDKASDFALKTLDDQTVRLGDVTAKGTVVLIVLRG
jgi:hypothetical protein